MDVACKADDGTLYYELNLAFHELILNLSGNQRAKQAYDDYVKELHLFRRKFFNVSSNMHKSNAEHRKIYERSEEHTSELQSLMRISYAVFCLKKKNHIEIILRL